MGLASNAADGHNCMLVTIIICIFQPFPIRELTAQIVLLFFVSSSYMLTGINQVLCVWPCIRSQVTLLTIYLVLGQLYSMSMICCKQLFGNQLIKSHTSIIHHLVLMNLYHKRRETISLLPPPPPPSTVVLLFYFPIPHPPLLSLFKKKKMGGGGGGGGEHYFSIFLFN